MDTDINRSLAPSTSRDELIASRYIPGMSGKSQRPLRTLSSLIRLLAQNPIQLTISLIILASATCATVAQPRIVGMLIDRGILPHDTSQITFFVAFFITMECVRVCSITLQGICVGRLGHDVMHSLRVSLLERVLRLRVSSLDHLSTGAILSRVTTDVGAVGQLFSVGIITIVEKIFVVTGTLIALVTLSPKLASMALLLIPCLLLAGAWMSGAVYRYTTAIRQDIAGHTALVTDTLRCSTIVRTFGLSHAQFIRSEILNQRLAKDSLRPLLINAFFHPGTTLVNAISIGLVMYFGSGMVRSGELPLGVLVSFLSYTLYLFWPVIHIVNQWSVLITGLASLERVIEVLDWPQEATSKSSEQFDPEPHKELVGEIAFENVWFRYSDQEEAMIAEGEETPRANATEAQQWVLRNLSFTIRPGEKVGLVGATGSGKTTILSLLFRLYTPQRGTIRLNGVPLDKWPRDTLRRYIGLLQQDGMLFTGSVAENLTFFDDTVPCTLPKRLQDSLIDIDRNATEISSGEKQWLLFARSFLRSPKLWVLDEAAAHLDPALDEVLHETVHTSAKGSTLLVVAHRLSTVHRLDRLIVLHHGCVVESGSPGELSKAGGLYERLLRAQESGYL